MAPLKIKRNRPCSICFSPYREEVEGLIRKSVPLVDIAKKYHKLLVLGEVNCYQKLRRHVHNQHPPRIVDTTPVEPEDKAKEEVYSIEEYADMLLKKAMTDPSIKISHSQAIAAQKVLIEKKKLEATQDKTKMEFLRLMRGTPIIEGEVVNEPRQIAASSGTDQN